MKLDIVLLSHLSWDRKLFQRPQQLATRFARAGDTVHYFSVERLAKFLDTPLLERMIDPAERLHAMMLPQVPGSWRFGALGAMTDALVAAKGRAAWSHGPRVLWCQHPRFVGVANSLKPDLLVYDCMDPHGAFAGRDRRVADFEAELLSIADIVFAGGRSLAASLEERGAHPECLPSGIDFDHFARAASPGPIPKEAEKLDRPILGYFGAVDERIDWDLLVWLARERRSWTIAIVGPIVGNPPIPKEPNIVIPGGCDYAALPNWLRAFDVCLIPWKSNELTRFMSPTKTPEYLASGRPVVSTPIPDVQADYGDVVLTGATKEEFLAACQRALVQGKGEPVRPPASRSWDEIAGAMRERMRAELGKRRA